ncbi:MAG: DUF4124 domain-containing protein [Gammaproteobacteria bacterium]|nr:DUF4124 domain-containing protein [Gammaproteobacteria bacterium]
MFIHYLQYSCLTFVIVLFAATTSADVYKWVDKDGQTHYSQQAPSNQQADLIKTPPPPTIGPTEAQQQIDALIEQQKENDQAATEKRNQARQEAEKIAQKKENCRIAQQNLQQYMDNPGRRIVDEDGNVTRLPEEERQQKIKQLHIDVKEYCQ